MKGRFALAAAALATAAQEQTEIGGDNRYVALCHRHFMARTAKPL
jgi:thymidine kinase